MHASFTRGEYDQLSDADPPSVAQCCFRSVPAFRHPRIRDCCCVLRLQHTSSKTNNRSSFLFSACIFLGRVRLLRRILRMCLRLRPWHTTRSVRVGAAKTSQQVDVRVAGGPAATTIGVRGSQARTGVGALAHSTCDSHDRCGTEDSQVTKNKQRQNLGNEAKLPPQTI